MNISKCIRIMLYGTYFLEQSLAMNFYTWLIREAAKKSLFFSLSVFLFYYILGLPD